MFGHNVGEMMRAADRDQREAQARVWDEVAAMIASGMDRRKIAAACRVNADDLRRKEID